jgi:hypothetical protein
MASYTAIECSEVAAYEMYNPQNVVAKLSLHEEDNKKIVVSLFSQDVLSLRLKISPETIEKINGDAINVLDSLQLKDLDHVIAEDSLLSTVQVFRSRCNGHIEFLKRKHCFNTKKLWNCANAFSQEYTKHRDYVSEKEMDQLTQIHLEAITKAISDFFPTANEESEEKPTNEIVESFRPRKLTRSGSFY